MKRIILILLISLIATNASSYNGKLRESTYEWQTGCRGTIIWGNIHKDGYHKYYDNIKCINESNYDLMFIIKYRRCNAKLISKKNLLSDKNCSETVKKTVFVPANSRTEAFDLTDWKDTWPYLSRIGGLDQGFDIIDFKVELAL